jgi:hypothetical protein
MQEECDAKKLRGYCEPGRQHSHQVVAPEAGKSGQSGEGRDRSGELRCVDRSEHCKAFKRGAG